MSKTDRRSQAYHATGVGHYYTGGGLYHWSDSCARLNDPEYSPKPIDVVVAWESPDLDPCPDCCPVHDPQNDMSLLWMLEGGNP